MTSLQTVSEETEGSYLMVEAGGLAPLGWFWAHFLPEEGAPCPPQALTSARGW